MVELNRREAVQAIEYSYEAVPTIGKFALDDRPLRILMGPFGCLSGDHEFLTRRGWKRIDAYQPGDEVAVVDPHQGRTWFEYPQGYIDAACDEMIHLRARGVDLLMSPEHRVLYAKKYNRHVPRVCTAEEVYADHQDLADGWDGLIPATFAPPENARGYYLSDDDLRLMVAVCADGHLPKSGVACHICLRKERKKVRLRDLLTRCERSWEEREYPGRPGEITFVFEPPERNKSLAAYWEASPRQWAILYDEIPHWDGMADCGYGSQRFVSTHGPSADLAQMAFTVAGHRSSISIQSYDDREWADAYHVAACRGAMAGLRGGDKKPIDRVVPPARRKYCFTVSTGFFVTRRNGRIAVTGNSGKTSGCVMELVRRAQMQEPLRDGIRHTRFLCVRNTYRQLTDTTMNTVFQWLPPKYFGTFYKGEFRYVIDRLPDMEIEIIFRALDRPEHVQNLLSLELTGAFCNEVRELRWAIIEALMGRVGRYPAKNQGGCTWSGIWADTNPPSRTHWIYRRFEENPPPASMGLYKQPSGLVPEAENMRWLPDNYYTNLADIMDPESARVYVEGEYGVIKAGKPVFPQFSDALHVVDALQWDGRSRLWRGWDFGLTPAVVICQLTANGQLQILCEMTTERAGIDIFADLVISECQRRYPGAKYQDVADPAGRQGMPMQGKEGEKVMTCYSILQGKGIHPLDGDNSLNMRLDAVRYGLRTLTDNGMPMLVVDRHEAIMIRDGLAGAYHYREIINTQTIGTKHNEEPEKNEYSHPMDALQYICEHVFGFLLRKEKRTPEQAFQDPTDPTEAPDTVTLYAEDDDDEFDDDVQEWQQD